VLLSFYDTYAAKPDTVMGLSWRYGFQDPHANTLPASPSATHCSGSFDANGGSPYCHYGREWECFVAGLKPVAPSLGASAGGAASSAACQGACAAKSGCQWWLLSNSSGERSIQYAP